MIGTVALGILVPFIGTSLGAAMVFLLKKEINPKTEIIAGVRLGGDDCGVHLVAHSAFGGIGERSKNNRMASRRGRLRRGDACAFAARFGHPASAYRFGGARRA